MTFGLILAATLFSGGTTDWKIAYEACEKNTPVEYGARELQAALKAMSGAEFAAGEGAAALTARAAARSPLARSARLPGAPDVMASMTWGW